MLQQAAVSRFIAFLSIRHETRCLQGLTLLCALGLAACGERPATNDGSTLARPGGVVARSVAADELLVSRVRGALSADGSLDAEAIGVTANSGEITLDGTVPAAQITRADSVARSVSGVREVINSLRPALPRS